jgi:hypothetical protein
MNLYVIVKQLNKSYTFLKVVKFFFLFSKLIGRNFSANWMPNYLDSAQCFLALSILNYDEQQNLFLGCSKQNKKIIGCVFFRQQEARH